MVQTWNRAAWDGDVPLVAPLEPTPYGPGDLVSCRTPVDADGFATIRGIVVHVEADEDGEATVTMAREGHRPGIRRAGAPSYRYSVFSCPASELDREVTMRSTPDDRYATWRQAARIFASVAYDHINSSKPYTSEELYLLGAAQQLASLAGRRHAS